MTREKFDELISQFASSDEHKFDNIFLVLAGELNTDHLDVVRWRYLDENDDPRYMTRKEYDNFIDAWVTKLTITKSMTSDMLSELGEGRRG